MSRDYFTHKTQPPNPKKLLKNANEFPEDDTWVLICRFLLHDDNLGAVDGPFAAG